MAAACIGLVLSAAPAHADATRSYVLDYRADQRCPDDAALVARIERRSPNSVRVASGGAVKIEVELHDDPPRATLRFTEHGSTTERELTGSDCDEVASAVALTLALLLEPDAAEPEPRAPAASAPPPRTTPAPTTATSPAPAPRREASWEPSVAAQAGVQTGIGDGLTPYVGLGVALASRADSLLSPQLRLDALWGRGRAESAIGSADLEWLAARVAICPLTLSAFPWSLRSCASFELGRLSADGSGVSDPRSASAWWYGPGAELRPGVRVLDRLGVSLEAGVTLMLARDRFYFRPNHEVHRVPDAAAHVGLAIEVVL